MALASRECRRDAPEVFKLRGLVPGPHKIWLANPALSRTIVPTGGYFQTVSLTLMAYDVPSDAVGLDQ